MIISDGTAQSVLGQTPDAANGAVRIVDVRAFGAKADGVSNDAPAFNAAINFIRSHQVRLQGYNVCHKLLIPSGVYLVNETIDMTQVQGINMVLDGDSSVILGKCAGEPVIDALGSRWLTIRDLTIIGDRDAIPKVGIQIGRMVSGIVADDHRFENVKILGSYSLACLLNLAAETCGFDHLLLWNNIKNPDSYCLVLDGLNHFATASKFGQGHAAAVEKDDSFNENEFTNCDFRHSGGGIPVWLGNTARLRFFRCYAAGDGRAAIVVYCSANSHLMLDVDCHCETDHLRSVFLFTGSRTSPVIEGFRYVDHRAWAAESIFACEPQMGQITLLDAHIEIAGFAGRSCKVFDDPAKWRVTGYYSSRGDTEWNGQTVFSGMLMRGNDVQLAGQVGVKVQSGQTHDRPAGLGAVDAGRAFLDLSSNKLVLWSGAAWVDTSGSPA
jgi:hypothetical protein